MRRIESIPDPQFEKYIKFVTKLFENYGMSDVGSLDFVDDFLPRVSEISQKVFGPIGIDNNSPQNIEYLYIYLTTGERPSLKTYNVPTYEDFWVKQRYHYQNEVSSYFDTDYFDENYVWNMGSSWGGDYDDLFSNFEDSTDLGDIDFIDHGIGDIEEI
jgi:hypothetical protein